MSVRFVAAVLASFVCASQNGLAQDAGLPPRDPFLHIEANMHTGAIRRIGADAACTMVATASEDKTVRLWGLADNKLLKVMRPPVGPGNDGKVYAVAIAPKGEWIAAGGFSRTPGYHFVYLFDAATGSMVRSFGPFPQIIEHLAVSPDGRLLAATLRSGQGVRVWRNSGINLASWELVVDDREYGGKDSMGAAFDQSGALYTVGYDRRLRRYAPGERRPETLITSDLDPHSVSVNPTDGRVAVSYEGGHSIDVYEVAPLRRSFAVEAGPACSGALTSVAWSGDGQSLFAGGTYARDKFIDLIVWEDRGKGSPQMVKGSRDAIMHLFPCGDGVVVAAADPAFGLFRGNGSRQLWNESVGADMRGKLQENFTVSADGLRVRFGLQEGGTEPVLFEMPAGVFSDAPAGMDELYPPDERSLSLSNWRSSETPRLEGNVLTLARRERAHAVAVLPDESGFVLGADYSLRRYDRGGTPVWAVQAPGAIWGVNVAREKNLILAACGDGTLRWYDFDGKLLASVFIHRRDRRWIAWTPSGYFTTSAGGEDLIGWTVNRSWNESADYFAVSQFRKIFYRPDIVKQVLAEAKADVNDASSGSSVVLKHQPPVVQIVSPGERYFPQSNDVTVTFVVRSPSGTPIKKLSLYVGGVLANPDANTALMPLDSSYKYSGQLKVKIPSQNVEISLVAETADGESEPARSSIIWPTPQPTTTRKPNLYALLIGVGDYDDKTLKLLSPANDVDDFEFMLRRQEGKAFNKITIVKLKDRKADRESEPATKDNIIDKVIWLRKQVPYNDIAMVYFSGHGRTLAANLGSYLLPVDFDGETSKTGIDKDSLFRDLKQIAGGLILFVDACYAADAFDTIDFVNDTSSWKTVGVISYASSGRSEVSRTRDRNSFFTSALKNAFGGNAKHSGNALQTDELTDYLRAAVPQLAMPDKQTPQMNKSQTWKHIPIAED